MLRNSQIEDKYVFISGASSGIGRSCALYLDKLGFRVLAGYRKAEDAQSLRSEASERLCPIHCDIAHEESIQTAAAQIEKMTGAEGLFCLINNAGIVIPGHLEIISIAEMKKQFNVNVFGTLALTQACLPFLRSATGRIIMIGSILGELSIPSMGPYSSSKHAIHALTRALRLELLAWNIPVSLIEAGNISTPLWNKGIVQGQDRGQFLDSQQHTLYDSLIQKSTRYFEAMSSQGIPAVRVAQLIAKVLQARSPKHRYIVGLDARILSTFIAWLPEWLIDRMIIQQMKLRGPA